MTIKDNKILSGFLITEKHDIEWYKENYPKYILSDTLSPFLLLSMFIHDSYAWQCNINFTGYEVLSSENHLRLSLQGIPIFSSMNLIPSKTGVKITIQSLRSKWKKSKNKACREDMLKTLDIQEKEFKFID